MKILQVLAGGKHGGAETAFVDMCIAMKEFGVNIEVATRPNKIRVPRLKKAGIKVHQLPFGGKVDILTPWFMRRIIKKFKPDIVQTWMSRSSDKTPAWDDTMGIPPYKVVARLGNYYKLKYFESVDNFVTITPDIKTYLIDNGVEADRIIHINNFADTEHVTTPINRATYDTPEDAPLLLGLGRLHDAKAFDTLIKVVARLPGVYCWIAGEGPERSNLEKLIFEKNVGDRVKLLGWQSDRAALFQACDICVFSSRFEPFGTVFVQAWAQKIPLVTTRADGPRQFVRHEQDGLVVEIDNIPAMQNEIKRLIDDRVLAATLVERAYTRYKAEFTKEKTVQAYLDFYKKIRTENTSENKAA